MKKNILLLFIFLAGCSASLEDLQAMSPDGRADYVCERHQDVKSLDQRIATTEGAISETESAISLGYRLVQVCKEVPVVVNTEERCKTDEDGEKVCKGKSKVSHEKVCEDFPVAVDGYLEESKLERYRGELAQLDAEVGRVFDACYRRVQTMSAGAAFDYYESTRGGGLVF